MTTRNATRLASADDVDRTACLDPVDQLAPAEEPTFASNLIEQGAECVHPNLATGKWLMRA
jgi:hypothetical protein